MKSGRREKCFTLKYSTRKCNYSKEGTFRQHSKVTEELIVFLFRFFVFVFLSFVLLVFSLTIPEVVCKDIILMVKVNPFISIQKLLELPTQCKLVKQFNTPTPDNYSLIPQSCYYGALEGKPNRSVCDTPSTSGSEFGFSN